MDSHTPGLKRHLTDAELQKYTTTELKDLAGECDVEPADASICDACAAAVIVWEREANEVVLSAKDAEQFRLGAEFVLGATDADALHPPHQVRDGLLAYQVAANRDEWMARAMVAEAAVAELIIERDNLSQAYLTVLGEKGELMVRLSQLLDNERPSRFMPGDRVMVMLGNSLEGGTVEQIRIPGPMRPEKTVYIALDLVDAGGLSKNFWFNHEHVERIRG